MGILKILSRQKGADAQPDGKRNLLARLIFTALAFMAMISLSYVFVRKIIYQNLSRNADNVMVIVQDQIENDLNNPKMYLSGFAQTMRTAIISGSSAETINEYFADLSEYINSSNQCLLGFDGLLGYF